MQFVSSSSIWRHDGTRSGVSADVWDDSPVATFLCGSGIGDQPGCHGVVGLFLQVSPCSFWWESAGQSKQRSCVDSLSQTGKREQFTSCRSQVLCPCHIPLVTCHLAHGISTVDVFLSCVRVAKFCRCTMSLRRGRSGRLFLSGRIVLPDRNSGSSTGETPT